ncbi:MAG: patatin-like phospholipase family protein [Leptothrix sp. (in: b-proteobacteria)]
MKILSLDGGGSWALLQALALGEIYEQKTGHEILGKFDLVFATSGGGLVLGGLLANKTPHEILEFFLSEDNRNSIFSRKISYEINKIVGMPKYKTVDKLEGIKGMLRKMHEGLEDRKLHEIYGLTNKIKLPDIVITSFDYDRQRAVYFRSNTTSLASGNPVPLERAQTPTVAEALHASSTAPVSYFDAPAEFYSSGFENRRFWDGGVTGMNNPVLAAVTEALANQKTASDLSVLSIGTGSVMLLDPNEENAEADFLVCYPSSSCIEDVKKMAKSILDDPPDSASYIAYRIIHGSDNDIKKCKLVRMSPLVRPIKNGSSWTINEALKKDFNGVSKFVALTQLGMDATDQDDVELIQEFGHLWMEDKIYNQLIQGKNGEVSTSLGHDFFSKALSRWKELDQ